MHCNVDFCVSSYCIVQYDNNIVIMSSERESSIVFDLHLLLLITMPSSTYSFYSMNIINSFVSYYTHVIVICYYVVLSFSAQPTAKKNIILNPMYCSESSCSCAPLQGQLMSTIFAEGFVEERCYFRPERGMHLDCVAFVWFLFGIVSSPECEFFPGPLQWSTEAN